MCEGYQYWANGHLNVPKSGQIYLNTNNSGQMVA